MCFNHSVRSVGYIIFFWLLTLRAYEEIIDFIAAGASPQAIIAFQPSQKTKNRVADLIYREKTGSFSPDEK